MDALCTKRSSITVVQTSEIQYIISFRTESKSLHVYQRIYETMRASVVSMPTCFISLPIYFTQMHHQLAVQAWISWIKIIWQCRLTKAWLIWFEKALFLIANRVEKVLSHQIKLIWYNEVCRNRFLGPQHVNATLKRFLLLNNSICYGSRSSTTKTFGIDSWGRQIQGFVAYNDVLIIAST